MSALFFKTETKKHPWESFLSWEPRPDFSRKSILLTGNVDYPALSVLAVVNGKAVLYDSAGADGSEDAICVLTAGVDATDGDTEGVALTRMVQIKATGLMFKDGETQAGKDRAAADLDVRFVQVVGGI